MKSKRVLCFMPPHCACIPFKAELPAYMDPLKQSDILFKQMWRLTPWMEITNLNVLEREDKVQLSLVVSSPAEAKHHEAIYMTAHPPPW